MMNTREYNLKKAILEDRIAFNKRIHCERVAAKFERQLKELEDEYGRNNKD